MDRTTSLLEGDLPQRDLLGSSRFGGPGPRTRLHRDDAPERWFARTARASLALARSVAHNLSRGTSIVPRSGRRSGRRERPYRWDDHYHGCVSAACWAILSPSP